MQLGYEIVKMFYSEVEEVRKHFMGETALKNGAVAYFLKNDGVELLFNFLKEICGE